MNEVQLKQHIEDSWKFYREVLGSAKYFLAPMVDQSELAFRQLCRKYGAQVCYSPMLHSRVMLENPKYIHNYLGNRKGVEQSDQPLIVQLCGNDNQVILEASKLVQNECQAIDLNLGCPQGIARKGHYGSYLLQEPQRVNQIVYTLKQGLHIPVTCKNHGCSLLTVHGRTKEQKKDLTGACNWDIIKEIKEKLSIPVIANGGIYYYTDVQKCLEYTGCDGVMSSEGALENVGIFRPGKLVDLDTVAGEYLELAEKTGENPSFAKSHLFKLLHKGLREHTDLRSRLGMARGYQEFRLIQLEMQARRNHLAVEDKYGWYWRHLLYNNKSNQNKQEQQQNNKQQKQNDKEQNNKQQKQNDKEQNDKEQNDNQQNNKEQNNKQQNDKEQNNKEQNDKQQKEEDKIEDMTIKKVKE